MRPHERIPLHGHTGPNDGGAIRGSVVIGATGGVDTTTGSGGSTSAPVNFDDLADVYVPSPADQDVATWDAGTSKWIAQAAPGASGGITVEDEGTPLSTTATTLDFVGAGVTASGTGATKTITIPGGSGLVIEEVDGSPTNTATKLKFPNGTLSYSGTEATYTPAAGSGNLSAPSAVSVDLGASSLLTRRATANTEDDLFDAGSINAKWTQRGTWTIGTLPGWVRCAGSGYLVQAVPAGDWTIETELIIPQSTTSEYTAAGLFISTSSTPDTAGTTRVMFVGRNNSIRQWRIGGDNLVSGAYNSQIFTDGSATWLPLAHCFVRIVRASSTSYQFEVSMTGWNDWQAVYTGWNPGITVAYFGLYASGSGSNPVQFNGFYRY